MKKVKDYSREINFSRELIKKQVREVVELIHKEVRATFAEDIVELAADYGALRYIDIMVYHNEIYLVAAFKHRPLSVCTKLGEKMQFEDPITNTLMKWSVYVQDKYMWVFKAVQALEYM
jgi:actin-like ATPase involved in cell morphogenesis